MAGHESEPYPSPAVTQHAVAIHDGTRLAGIVGEPEALVVNSYHHQAVTPDRLAPALVANALADHDGTMLVEGLEARDPDRWLIGRAVPPGADRVVAGRARAAVERLRGRRSGPPRSCRRDWALARDQQMQTLRLTGPPNADLDATVAAFRAALPPELSLESSPPED